MGAELQSIYQAINLTTRFLVTIALCSVASSGCRTVKSDPSTLDAIGDRFKFDWGDSAQTLVEIETALNEATGCKRIYLQKRPSTGNEELLANSASYHQARLDQISETHRDVPQDKWYLYRQYLLNVRTNIDNIHSQTEKKDSEVLKSIKRHFAAGTRGCAIDLHRNATDYYRWPLSVASNAEPTGKDVFVFFGGITEFDSSTITRALKNGWLSEVEAPWSDRFKLHDLLQRQLRFYLVAPKKMQDVADASRVKFYLGPSSAGISSDVFNNLIETFPRFLQQADTIAKHYFTYEIDPRDTHTHLSGVKILFSTDEKISWYYAGDSVDRSKEEGGPVTLIRYIKLDLVSQSVEQSLTRLKLGSLR